VKKTYAIPLDELQELNPDVPVDMMWASDCVVCGDANPVLENIADEVILNVDVMDFTSLCNHVDCIEQDDIENLKKGIDNWKRND